MKYLTENQKELIAEHYRIELPALKAVLKVEAAGSGFNRDGRIKVLFEGHKFYKHSKDVPVSSIRPDLSHKNWSKKYYNQDQHKRVKDAIAILIDHRWKPLQAVEAAYRSASWGLGQILGENYAYAGHESAVDMVNSFEKSENNQLKGMMNFIVNHPTMYKALREKDWGAFARQYNGPGYKKNNYDTKLASAYEEFNK